MNVPSANMDQPDRSAAEFVHAVFRFVRVLKLRRSYVITALIVAGLLGSLYYFTATRIYEATATLLVTQNGADVFNTTTTPDGVRDGIIPTYERLISSAVVLDAAIERLRKLPPAARIDLAQAPREKWRDVLRKNLSARGVRRTNIIEVRYQSKSPQAAEAVINAIVDSYLEFIENNHKDLSVEIATILRNELREKERELQQKQQVYLRLKREAGDLDLPEGSTVVHPIVQRAITINHTLLELREQRLKLHASLEAIRSAVKNGGDLRHHLIAVEPFVGRELVMGALGLNPQLTEVAGKVEEKLIANRALVETYAGHYGPTHPEMLRVRQEIDYAEGYLAQYQSKFNARLESSSSGQLGPLLISMVEEKLAETRAAENQLIAQYQQSELEAVRLNDRMAVLRLVESELHRLRNWHDTLLNQISNIDLRQERADVRVAIVSEPAAENSPVSPRLSTVAMLVLFGGFGVGAAIVYVLDLLDDRFRSPDELKDQLGAPILAAVRKLPGVEAAGPDAILVHVAPNAVEAEAFRTLRTTLAFSEDDRQRVAITSAEPGDGKTTVLVNLAASYAQAGKRTLVIDCDLRRPGLSKMFNMRGLGGLSEILRDQDNVAQACAQRVCASGIDGLDVLPCGPKPPDPAELLGGSRFSEVIAWAESCYDQVLVDCPPVMAASDAAIVGRLVDGTMLVVRPEKNHRRLVLRAAEHLSVLQVELIGVIVNRVENAISDGYYGYGYGYGYGYDEAYGYEEEEYEDEPPSPADVIDRAA